jgi:hypothetical protein
MKWNSDHVVALGIQYYSTREYGEKKVTAQTAVADWASIWKGGAEGAPIKDPHREVEPV